MIINLLNIKGQLCSEEGTKIALYRTCDAALEVINI
jgi:hypothetical protein